MTKNIAVKAFCEQDGKTELCVKSPNDLIVKHVDENPKSCRVPDRLKNTLRELRTLGEKFAYVVATSTLPNAETQRLLMPMRDLGILTKTLNN